MADYRENDFKRHYKAMLRARKGRSIIKTICRGILDQYRLADAGYSDYFFLSHVIEDQLYSRIFQEEYPIGITDGQKSVLHEAEEGMKSSTLHRGT
jgi:hypothetical protein